MYVRELSGRVDTGTTFLNKNFVFKTVREYEISEANFFTSIIILHFWKLSDPNTVHAGGE